MFRRFIERVKAARQRRAEALTAAQLRRQRTQREYYDKMAKDFRARRWNEARHSPGNTDL